MAITVQEVTNVAIEVNAIAQEILSTAAALDPALAAPIGLAETLATIGIKALKGWSDASGIPITAESVLALLPDSTPLTPPTA